MFATPGVRRQLAAAIICSIGCLIAGLMVGWPAPTLKKLRQPDSPVHLTPHEEAWVVNAMYYGTILSPFPSGFLINLIGRKTTLLVLAVFPTLSWILVYFSTSATMLMVARLFSGFWLGGIQTVVPLYTGEISEPHVRGIFGSFFQVSSFVGNNFSFIVAPYVTIQTMATICGFFPVLFIILFVFCPESPYYYAMKKNSKAAGKSLSWLRGDEPIMKELQTIQTSVDKELKDDETFTQKLTSIATDPANRKGFIIVETLDVMQRLCGISCMKAFSSIILPPKLGPLTTDHCTIIIGFVWMFSSLICTGLIDKAGRKPLLYASSLGIFVSMLWTGIWYYLNDNTDIDVSSFKWLPLAGFLVFGVTFSFGLGPIVKIYQGEMFPNNLKGMASALTAIIAAFASSVSTGMFPILTETIGMYANFLIFSAVGLVNFLFTYFYVIETKGKSLQEIQAELNGERPVVTQSNGDSEKAV
ncbi:facilitated trehalose transporter Tret1 isoform X2 [Bemisia tabaci]|uniref:facilitated trehalose transporter Tret1 isoform X2 n=1 Tax=Bemisia tabaci TaxID=7038 RepID=UPI0008F9D2B2|nr:PREDICTED: facilitated trehalose transporter Tret1-like isoform X2 [Bemisia tabaci]